MYLENGYVGENGDVGENYEGVLPISYLGTAHADIRDTIRSFKPGAKVQSIGLFGANLRTDKGEIFSEL